MNSTYIIIAVVLILMIMGSNIGANFFSHVIVRRKLHDQFGTEYDHTVKTLGSEKKAQTELNERQEYVKALNIRPLSITSASVIWLIGLLSN